MILLQTVTIRRLSPEDDLVALTGLLHRAYARLAEAGMNFTATDQSPERTRERCAEGECWVAELEAEVVGTITWCSGGDPHDPPAYREAGFAHFNQFAVEPDLQGRGIGDQLLAIVEERASEEGFHTMTLDTAEPARHLVEFYEKRGYREIAKHQWGDKTYCSVILAKPLA